MRRRAHSEINKLDRDRNLQYYSLILTKLIRGGKTANGSSTGVSLAQARVTSNSRSWVDPKEGSCGDKKAHKRNDRCPP